MLLALSLTVLVSRSELYVVGLAAHHLCSASKQNSECAPGVFEVSDVEDVKFVINFDYPSSSEDYVHRIGRTGRSQRTGTAYTFFTTSNARQAADLVAVLREANQVINPKLYEMAENSKGFGGR
ncbi:hypothetical protein PR048_010208, partial [Dryococelus australis]